MKVCLYAGDMNLYRKMKTVCRKKNVLGNKTVKTFFLVKIFYSPMHCYSQGKNLIRFDQFTAAV